MTLGREPSFVVRVRQWETDALVSAGGVVDFTVAPVLRAVLHDLLDDLQSVTVDLAETTLLDGHSIGMLVSTHRWAAKHGSELRLREAHGRVLRVLEITDAAKLLDPPADAADAAGPAGDSEDRTVETLLRARQRHATGDAPREQLRQLAIAAGYDLAASLARGYRGRGENAEDLLQVAMVGLIKAVDRYDPDRGPGFSAYAVPTIGGEIKRHFRDKGWTIRVPRRMQELGMDLPRAREALVQEQGRTPTAAEMADRLGVSVEDLIETIEAGRMYRLGSLSAPLRRHGEGTATVGDLVGAPDGGFDLVDDRESLRGLLDQLPAREQRILALRFYGNLTQSEIATQVGISQMHVSRLLTGALRRLREGLNVG
jgi:RNA polymerase sigma-B factor